MVLLPSFASSAEATDTFSRKGTLKGRAARAHRRLFHESKRLGVKANASSLARPPPSIASLRLRGGRMKLSEADQRSVIPDFGASWSRRFPDTLPAISGPPI